MPCVKKNTHQEFPEVQGPETQVTDDHSKAWLNRGTKSSVPGVSPEKWLWEFSWLCGTRDAPLQECDMNERGPRRDISEMMLATPSSQIQSQTSH